MMRGSGPRPAGRRLARGVPRVASACKATVGHARPPRSQGLRPGIAALAVASLLLAPAFAAAADAPSYTVARTEADGARLLAGDEAAWAGAAPIAWGPAPYTTRFRAVWSDEALYLRFDATDPSPWHTMTREDEHLWEEEVVEIFMDLDRSGRDYYELEVNPANVVCDLRMISPAPNQKGDIDWDLAGLETRVHPIRGAEKTVGWMVTAALPWPGLRAIPSARKVAVPPNPGDAWRFNVFRIERPGGPQSPAKDAVFAAWSPPSGKSFHDAGAFRDLVFAGASR
jgi:Carbohydrate family 9 binding domain-like